MEGEKLRVLHIEDDADDRMAVRSALRGLDPPIEVAEAETLDTALELLDQHRYDAILLDLSLPDSGAVQTFRALEERAHDAPIVVFTGYGDETSAIEAVRAGAQDYLLKGDIPIDKVLARSLRYAVTRHRTEAALRDSEQQLIEAQKMEAVGRLAGGVAHDFNNLLTIIFSYGRFVMDQLHPSDPVREDMEEIMKAADRAEKLTGQLLAFSRRQTIAPEVVNLNQTIGDLDRMLRRVLSEDVELVTRPARELWNVHVDPRAIEQVMLNLAINARDAMPAGGKLTVETDNVVLGESEDGAMGEIPPGPYVRIAVSDNGTGMSADVQARIFEPFYTTKQAGKGTGLGLSTCYGIVKQAQGHISVYSELGYGTTFKVYLPRTTAEPNPRLAEIPARTTTGDEVILIVEDDDQVRAIAARSLAKLGYRVLTASSGIEALVICDDEDQQIDLLLTDVVMPGMSGQALVGRLARQRPDLKVLYTSGYTANAIVHHGVLDEGMALLQKPFTPEALANEVRYVLESDGFRARDYSPRPRVLLVDDDPRVRSILESRLSDEFEVTAAAGGKAALEALQARDFDAVLCDLSMPDMSGRDLYEQTRQLKPELAERFVFVSGLSDERVRAALGKVNRPVVAKIEGPGQIRRALKQAIRG